MPRLHQIDIKQYTATVSIMYEGGEIKTFRLLREEYLSLSLPPLFDEMSEVMLAELALRATYADATELALSYVAKSSMSRQKLYEKLRGKGVAENAAKAAVRMMVTYGYLKEQAQIEDLILRYVANGKGPLAIEAKLASLGYRTKDIEAVESKMKADGTLDYDRLQKQAKEKLRAEGLDEMRIRRKLSQLGFMSDEDC